MADEECIDVKLALKDFLRDNGLTLDDILSVMDEDKEGAIEALRKRTLLSEHELEQLERKATSRQLNTLLFVIQLFYLANPSGLYKNKPIYPCRDDVVRDGKITAESVKQILKILGVHIDWS
jgi:DNA-binding transcriptional MerR regulator